MTFKLRLIDPENIYSLCLLGVSMGVPTFIIFFEVKDEMRPERGKPNPGSDSATPKRIEMFISSSRQDSFFVCLCYETGTSI